MTLRVFLIAGEASGDQLGAALMAGLSDLTAGEVSFDGVGGTKMAAQGLQSRFEMSELSVMGLAEVLPKYRQLKRRIAQTAQAVIDTQPDVLITIDSPDFCFRVVRLVKAAHPSQRAVHYVAPSVWAWRPGRAKKVAGLVDQLLAILPFEPPYFETHGLRCDFVGHPVASAPVASHQDVVDFRKMHGIEGPVTLVLPGSRQGEVTRLAPVFGAAVGQMRVPGHLVVPTVPHMRDQVTELVAQWSCPATVIGPDEKPAAFATADLALAASGTVSLELAANDVPMVIGYDLNWLSAAIMRRMAQIDTVTLVNLVSETRAVPEFLFERCKPDLLAKSLESVRADPAAQREVMAQTMARLGRGQEPGGLRAARAVLDGLDRG